MHDGLRDVFGVRAAAAVGVVVARRGRALRTLFPRGILLRRRRGEPGLPALLLLSRAKLLGEVIVADDANLLQGVHPRHALLLLALNPHLAVVQEERELSRGEEAVLRRQRVEVLDGDLRLGLGAGRGALRLFAVKVELAVVARALFVRESQRVGHDERSKHPEGIGILAHDEARVQVLVHSLALKVVNLDREKRGLGPGSLGEAHHGVRDGRLVEHLAESEHGHGFFPREAVLGELNHRRGVHAEVFGLALVVQSLGDGLDGNLPHVPEVFVPEPPGVHLLELVARARAVRVELRGLHQRVEVLAKFLLRSLQVVLHFHRILARGRDVQADAHAPAALLGRAKLDHAVDEVVELLHAARDVLQDGASSLVLYVTPIHHAVDLIDQPHATPARVGQMLGSIDPRLDLLVEIVDGVGEIHREAGDRGHHRDRLASLSDANADEMGNVEFHRKEMSGRQNTQNTRREERRGRVGRIRAGGRTV